MGRKSTAQTRGRGVQFTDSTPDCNTRLFLGEDPDTLVVF